jgi:phosphomannomutase
MLLFAADKKGIAKLVIGLPKRFTYSDRIQNLATEKSKQIIEQGEKQPEALLEKLGFFPL